MGIAYLKEKMKLSKFHTNLLICLSVLACSAISPSQAFAQEEEEFLGFIDLEEFVVTATKRERNAQELPMALTPFAEDQLEYSGVTDIRELMAISSSLFVTTSQAESTGSLVRIRGIGTNSENPGFESAVGVFIDGVYRSRNTVGLNELGDVERIEVLRGPQGTLFGRNTLMGLINVVTKGPSFEQGGYGEIGYGNYNNLRLEAGVTGGLIDDTLAGRFDMVYTQRDGFLEDIATGRDYNDRDRLFTRGQLLFEPSDETQVRIIADYTDRKEQCCAAVTLVPGPTLGLIQALGADILGDPFDRKVSVNPNRDYNDDVSEWGISGEVTVDSSAASFTSLTAFRDWESSRGQDIDYTNLDIAYRDKGGYFQGFETFTQEFRVESEMEWVDWMVGLFFIREDLDYRDALRYGSAYEPYVTGLVSSNPLSGFYSGLTNLPPGQVFQEGHGVVEDAFKQSVESWALFSHNTFRVTEEFEITLGMRYTEETKNMDADIKSQNSACSPTFLANLGGAVAAGLVPPQAAPTVTGLACLPFVNPFMDGKYSDSLSEERWSSTASASYHLSEDFLLFAGFSRGFKAGGFNLDRAVLANPLTGGIPSASDLEFNEEVVDSFEIGGKFGLLENRATLNATVFYMDLKDYQLVSFTGSSFLVENIEDVSSKGIELETAAKLSNEFTLRGGATYADTRYGSEISNENLAGRQLSNAPKWTFTGSATYERNLNNTWRSFANLDLRYMSSYNTGADLDIEKFQESYTVVNGRVGLAHLKDGWGVELWAKNLFNKDYILIAFDAPIQGSGTGPGSTQTFNSFLPEPRTFGVSLRKQF